MGVEDSQYIPSFKSDCDASWRILLHTLYAWTNEVDAKENLNSKLCMQLAYCLALFWFMGVASIATDCLRWVG